MVVVVRVVVGGAIVVVIVVIHVVHVVADRDEGEHPHDELHQVDHAKHTQYDAVAGDANAVGDLGDRDARQARDHAAVGDAAVAAATQARAPLADLDVDGRVVRLGRVLVHGGDGRRHAGFEFLRCSSGGVLGHRDADCVLLLVGKRGNEVGGQLLVVGTTNRSFSNPFATCKRVNVTSRMQKKTVTYRWATR